MLPLGSHRLIACLLAVLVLAGGCRTQGLAFRQDDRVEIVAPEENETVTLPFTLEWSVEDFDIVGPDGSDTNDAGYFGIFIDQTPMPPGESLRYIARDDDSCLRSADCPDETYLSDRNIYLTTDTQMTIDALQDTRPVDRPSAPDDHEITIVLLNGSNERIGEAAFTVEFTVDRGQG